MMARYRHLRAACSVGRCPRARTARRSRALRLSMALVTGMKGAGAAGVPVTGAGAWRRSAGVYGATVRDEGHREQTRRAGRCCTLGCEPVLVGDRPCDLPGCAVSADP